MQSDCAYTRAGAVPCGEQAHLQRRKSPPGCTDLGTQKVGIYVYDTHPYIAIDAHRTTKGGALERPRVYRYEPGVNQMRELLISVSRVKK